MSDLQSVIEAAWDARDGVSASTQGAVREAVDAALALLDSGQARVAEKVGNDWSVNQWLKKAVLLSFRLNPNSVMGADSGGTGPWFDKVATKFTGWGQAEFDAAGFRAVPGALVRRGAFVARNAVLMPPAIVIAPMLSPYAGPGIMARRS